jgi:zinc protease
MTRWKYFHVLVLTTSLCVAAVQALAAGQDAQTQSAPNGSKSDETPKSPSGIVPPGVKLVTQEPSPAPPKPFHFPQAATKTLPNGLRVFVVTDRSEPAVAARLVILSGGSIKDPAKSPGVARMTAGLLTQGTETRSAQQIAQTIDFIGGSLEASAGADSTSVTLNVVKKDLPTGLDLMSDVVLHPAFRAEELDRQRQQLLSGLTVQYSDPDYLASLVFDRTVYGNSPYGRPGEGTPDSVKQFTRDDFVKFHQSNYAPNESLLAFAGDISPEEAFAAAEKYFGPWPKHDAPAYDAGQVAAAPGVHIWLVDKPDAVQTQIRVGKAGIRRGDPNYIPALVMNRVFGGGYNSRLNTEVRVKRGLTYGANSSFDPHRYAGSFAAGTFSRTAVTVEATKLVVDLITQMSKGDITRPELDFARDYLAGVYPIQSETAEQVANRVLTAAAFDLPADYNSTYPDRVRAVTPEQANDMARRYLSPDDLDIVLAGNVGAFRDALKKAFPNATYQEIPYDRIDVLAPDLRAPAPAGPAK